MWWWKLRNVRENEGRWMMVCGLSLTETIINFNLIFLVYFVSLQVKRVRYITTIFLYLYTKNQHITQIVSQTIIFIIIVPFINSPINWTLSSFTFSLVCQQNGCQNNTCTEYFDILIIWNGAEQIEHFEFRWTFGHQCACP